MVILEQNFKWHLKAFGSELFIYTHTHITGVFSESHEHYKYSHKSKWIVFKSIVRI